MTPDRPELISSIHNPKVHLIRDLLTHKDDRGKHGLFVVEGTRLTEEVLAAGLEPRSVYFSSQLSDRGREMLEVFRNRGVVINEVYPDVLNRISDTETSQGILCLLPISTRPLPERAHLILIIDQLRDPGNMGTILRSAAASGVQAVFVTPGSVDPFMPKVVRAGMGAHFNLCIRSEEWTRIAQYCQTNSPAPLRILLADSASGTGMWQADLRIPLALVIGGEAEGASPEALKYVDEKIHIPMPGGFESLNAGVAASILLFEIIRQRQS